MPPPLSFLSLLVIAALPPAASRADTQPYDAPGWIHIAASTFPLTQSQTPTGNMTQQPGLIYSPDTAWNTLDIHSYGPEGSPLHEPNGSADGFDWRKATPTDSAAAATAISTGKKTFNNAINWGNNNQPLTRFALVPRAIRLGYRTGTVTSVEWSHATPACLSNAANVNRKNYREIAESMIEGDMTLIIGAGNPDFDNNGKPRTPAYAQDYDPANATQSNNPASNPWAYVGGESAWHQLKNFTHPSGRRLIQTREDFEALAAGDLSRLHGAERILGTLQVAETLQEKRAGNGTSVNPTTRIASVPSLATLTAASLQILARESHPFFLHVEGGAVDWANHDNLPGRMIEEQMEFNAAVAAADRFLADKNCGASRENTLLLVTADHETGCVFGPGSTPFSPIIDRGPGKIPALKFFSKLHTNALVPVFLRTDAPGFDLAGKIASLVKGTDRQLAVRYGLDPAIWDGQYLDNTDLYSILRAALDAHLNVILMISDGAGFNSWTATSMFEGKTTASTTNPANPPFVGHHPDRRVPRKNP